MERWILKADVDRIDRSFSDSSAAAQRGVLEALLYHKRLHPAILDATLTSY